MIYRNERDLAERGDEKEICGCFCALLVSIVCIKRLVRNRKRDDGRVSRAQDGSVFGGVGAEWGWWCSCSMTGHLPF